MINLKSAFNTGLGLARFFFRSPKDKAVEDFSASGVTLLAKIISLPEFAACENDFEALVKAFGWGVTRDKDTGHLTALQQPPGVWEMTQGGGWRWKPGE